MGKDRAQRLMGLHDIKARGKRKFVATTDSRSSGAEPYGRDCIRAAPDKVRSGDITYIATDGSSLYLAAVIDLVRRPSSWLKCAVAHADQLGHECAANGVVQASSGAGLIFHSDRGSQYCGAMFQVALTTYGMRSSMSRRSNCWEKAPTESLWGSLEIDQLYGKRFAAQR